MPSGYFDHKAAATTDSVPNIVFYKRHTSAQQQADKSASTSSSSSTSTTTSASTTHLHPRSKMSSPQTSPADRMSSQPYMLVPNLRVVDPSVREIDLGSHSWMVATVIEDDDLMFGGKPLSTWYEEDRRRLSNGHDEEETRGRQRERVRVDSHHQHHHHTHHTQHQHHGKNAKDAKQ